MENILIYTHNVNCFTAGKVVLLCNNIDKLEPGNRPDFLVLSDANLKKVQLPPKLTDIYKFFDDPHHHGYHNGVTVAINKERFCEIKPIIFEKETGEEFFSIIGVRGRDKHSGNVVGMVSLYVSPDQQNFKLANIGAADSINKNEKIRDEIDWLCICGDANASIQMNCTTLSQNRIDKISPRSQCLFESFNRLNLGMALQIPNRYGRYIDVVNVPLHAEFRSKVFPDLLGVLEHCHYPNLVEVRTQ